MAWKIIFTTLGDLLECYYFITHVHHCVMGATPKEVTLSQTDMLQINNEP